MGREICERLYWPPRSIAPLDGEVDESFLVDDAQGRRFVLKIAAPGADRATIELQNRVLEHLASRAVGPFPNPVPSVRGRTLEETAVDGRSGFVRLLSYLPGFMLVELPVKPPALLLELGRLLGRLDRVLGEIDDPAARRELQWDVSRLAEMPKMAAAIADRDRRFVVESMIDRYLETRSVVGRGLRRGLIHCDANDHNVLVSSLDPDKATVSGLIDFGDLLESDLVVELAVAMTYCGLGTPDPWTSALPVLQGFERELPLTDEELDVLFDAVCARLATSVSISARRTATGRTDAYAVISEKPAWKAIEALTAMDPRRATEVARHAVGRG